MSRERLSEIALISENRFLTPKRVRFAPSRFSPRTQLGRMPSGSSPGTAACGLARAGRAARWSHSRATACDRNGTRRREPVSDCRNGRAPPASQAKHVFDDVQRLRQNLPQRHPRRCFDTRTSKQPHVTENRRFVDLPSHFLVGGVNFCHNPKVAVHGSFHSCCDDCDCWWICCC